MVSVISINGHDLQHEQSSWTGNMHAKPRVSVTTVAIFDFHLQRWVVRIYWVIKSAVSDAAVEQAG